MSTLSRRTTMAMIAALTAVGIPAAYGAAEWSPSKTVRIVVPIVGSTNDVLARLVASKLSDAVGQPVIVENKGGAGGNIGAHEVVKSAPDGHTLLVGFNGPIAINKTLFKALPYDPEKDLIPVTLAVSSPQFLAINPKLPVKNVKELVELSKTRPLSYGSISMGSASHLTMEMLKAASGAELTHIPYKGAPPAVVDLMSGVIDVAFLVPGNIMQFVQDGRANVIATSGTKRFASMPQVPTMIEQGFPDFNALSWIGFLLPANTPKEIVNRYNTEIVKILKTPEIKEQLQKMEFNVVASSPEEFRAWIRAEIPRWGEVIKATGAQVE